MRLRLLVFAAGLLAGIALAAQEESDFSGYWVLEWPEVAPPNVARELVVSQWVEWSPLWPSTGQSFPATHIAIEQRLAGAEVRTDRYQVGIAGGIIPGIPPTRGSKETRFSSRWNGNWLEFEQGSYSWPKEDSGPYAEFREAWSLDANKLVIIRTARSSTTEPTTNTLTYRRQP